MQTENTPKVTTTRTSKFVNGKYQSSKKVFTKSLLDKLVSILEAYKLKPAFFIDVFVDSGRFARLSETQQALYKQYPISNDAFTKYSKLFEGTNEILVSKGKMQQIELFLSKYEKTQPVAELLVELPKRTRRAKTPTILKKIISLNAVEVEYYCYQFLCTALYSEFEAILLEAGVRVDNFKHKLKNAKKQGKGLNFNTKYSAIFETLKTICPPINAENDATEK